MKNTFTLFCLLLPFFSFAQKCPIIPLPNRVSLEQGVFTLTNSTAIIIDQTETAEHGNYLQREILQYTGVALSIQSVTNSPAIRLKKVAGAAKTSEEYTLQITPANVMISAGSNEGLFYGVVSFMQLMRQSQIKNNIATIDCWNIKDAPHYSWRGLMLDESRHFFGKQVVKSILDWMAFYKLNKFHWHLTDAPGWRLEIKSYQRLTLVGGIGNFYNPLSPTQYYTQEDIKEIISYANERYITIIPEIDMPGHATAANVAYPQFSGGGSERYPDFTFNPGKDSTYSYLTNILKETDVLFPSQMIHLGGDEVSFGNEKWNSIQEVKQLMQTNNLKDLPAVEHYFNRRIADSLFSLHNKLLCWDEAVDSDLPTDKTIICWWRHDKPEQLKKALYKQFSVVVCPRLPFYFDFVQDSTQKLGRKWRGGFNSLDKIYNFSVSSLPVAPSQQKQVLGMQAAIWTEVISTKEKLEYMLFPRIAALAETAWTREEHKNLETFLLNVKEHLPLYKKQNIYYYNPFAPSSSPEPLTADDRAVAGKSANKN